VWPDLAPETAEDAAADGTAAETTGQEIVDAGAEDVADVVGTPGPGPGFDRFCMGKPWDSDLAPATPGALSGGFVGHYDSFPEGTLETIKVIPLHPLHATTIRVAFSGGAGKARIRLMKSFGRSYPDTGNPEGDLITPIDVDIVDPDPEVWLELDISHENLFLEPTQHYILVREHLAVEPFLAVEEIGETGYSRSMIHVPGQFEPYGLDGNFRMELRGDYFCTWEEEDHWFSRDDDQPFTADMSARLTIADLNGDTHDDLVLIDGGPKAYLGAGDLSLIAAPSGTFPEGSQAGMVVFGDLDNDGDVDGFAPSWTAIDGDPELANAVWINDGAGQFSVVPQPGVDVLDPTGAAALGDGNSDGILDVFWGNWLVQYPESDAVADQYAEGVGDGTFNIVTEAAGVVAPVVPKACYGARFTDYNNDGHQDIWVGNYQLTANFFYHNNGDGTFTEMAKKLGLAKDDYAYMAGHTYGGDFGDYDNDGDMDLFEPNLAHPRTMPDSDDSRFLENQGPPDYEFVDRKDELGFIYDEGDVNASFGDYDNDMDLDVVVASLYTTHYSRLYRNDGEAGFVDVTYETGTAVHDAVSAVWTDLDEDGDLDLFIADRAGEGRVQLFENRVGQESAWVELLLEGTETNRSAVGARVTLKAGGVTQIRDVTGGGGHFNNQSSRVVHFGLGQQGEIEELTVRWVGGDVESFDGAAPNARYKVLEGAGQVVELAP